MSDIEVRITGQSDAIKALAKLGPAGLKAARNASRRVMRSVLKEAKSNTPKRTGTLIKSLSIKSKTYKRTGTIAVMVGPDKKITASAKAFGIETKSGLIMPSHYMHLVEFDSRRIKGHYLLTKALKSKGDPETAAQEIIKDIQKEIAKLEAKA